MSTDSLPLEFHLFRYSTRAVSISEGSLLPLYCMWACSSQYSYIKQWKKPGYSLLPLNFFFFLVYTFYILPLKLFLLHSCFTETQTPTALLGPTCTLNILSHCLISAVSCIMRRECALSLEIPINQVTRESIFVRFFIRNSREHDNI